MVSAGASIRCYLTLSAHGAYFIRRLKGPRTDLHLKNSIRVCNAVQSGRKQQPAASTFKASGSSETSQSPYQMQVAISQKATAPTSQSVHRFLTSYVENPCFCRESKRSSLQWLSYPISYSKPTNVHKWAAGYNNYNINKLCVNFLSFEKSASTTQQSSFGITPIAGPINHPSSVT